MRKAKQKPVGRQPKIDIGAELLASVREMKAGIRARVHCPEISAVGHARLASGLSQTHHSSGPARKAAQAAQFRR
ncbi:MAG: hypothetical protein M1492_09665 [Gammaproteobacteria bacterium]|nr:hypothetical protein [Gammaproteobacteria bacterium]